MQFYKTHPLRLIRRNLRSLQPISACVLIEIRARIDALINRVNAETGRRLGGGRGLRETDGTKQHQDEDKTGKAHDRILLEEDERDEF
jgi:hypothetical protein